MKELSRFCHAKLATNPEQVQIFTPTPSTVSTMMYCTGQDLDGNRVFSEHSTEGKRRQKKLIVGGNDAQH